MSYYVFPGVRKCDASLLTPQKIAENIIAKVCQYYNVNEMEVRSKSRKSEVVLARHFCVFFLKRKTRFPLRVIGDMFSGRDHTTCIHSIAYINGQLSLTNSDVKDDYSKLIQII